MKCRQITKHLHAFIQGHCTPQVHRRVQRHLRICRVCEAELSELREIVDTLGDTVPVPNKPATAWERIHDRVMADLDTPVETWRSRVRAALAVWVFDPLTTAATRPSGRYAYAGLAVTVAMMVIGLYQGLQFHPQKTTSPAPHHASRPAMTAAVLRAQGPVKYRPGRGDGDTQPLSRMIVLKEKARIATGEGSVCLGLGPATGVEISGNSEVTVSSLRRDSICLFVHRGTVLARVEKRGAGQVFRVETPEGACRVVGTRFAVRMNPDTGGEGRHAVFSVQKGAIDVLPSAVRGEEVRVAAGERVRVGLDGAVVSDSAVIDMASFAALDSMLGLLGLRAEGREVHDGCLQVISKPAGASVCVDSTVWGQTPLFSIARPGTYTVTVTKEGYESWSQEITAPSSGTYHLSVSLKKRAVSRRAGVHKRHTANDPVELSLLRAGLAKQREGDRAEALRAFQMIIEQDSVSEEVRRKALMGAYEVCLADSSYEQALAYLNALVDGPRRDAGTERALVERARLKAGRFDDIGGATKDYVRCLVDYPNGSRFDEATEGFASVVHRIGHRWRARRAYQRHLDLFQKSAEGLKILSSLARIWEQRFDECALALPCYALIVQEYADSPEMEYALFGYADCLRRTGRMEKAIEAYELYARKFPSGPRIAEVSGHLRGHEATAGGD
jgi:tetratricopeptide (TPR) repeat protein